MDMAIATDTRDDAALFTKLVRGVTAHLRSTDELGSDTPYYLSVGQHGIWGKKGCAAVLVWYADGVISEYVVSYDARVAKFATISAARLDVPDDEPRDPKRVQLHGPTARSLTAALLAAGADPPVAHVLASLEEASSVLKGVREDVETYQARRNNDLCELHFFHGWRNKVDLYNLVDIQRTELDAAIREYSLGNRTLRAGQRVVTDAKRAERLYRVAGRTAKTIEMWRDMLVRELRRGIRYPKQGVTPLAALLDVKTSRISQIANPAPRAGRTRPHRSSQAAPETGADWLRMLNIVGEHIGAAGVLADGRMVCAKCHGSNFRPTMKDAELQSCLKQGYLPGDPDLGGACMDCDYFTEPSRQKLDPVGWR